MTIPISEIGSQNMTQKRFGGKRVKRRNVLLGFKLGGDDDGQCICAPCARAVLGVSVGRMRNRNASCMSLVTRHFYTRALYIYVYIFSNSACRGQSSEAINWCPSGVTFYLASKVNKIDGRSFIFPKQVSTLFDFGMSWSHLSASEHTFFRKCHTSQRLEQYFQRFGPTMFTCQRFGMSLSHLSAFGPIL